MINLRKKCQKTLDKGSENILESINQSINQGRRTLLFKFSFFIPREEVRFSI